MLKQVIFTLMVLAGLSLAFSGCEEKNPTFIDPDPQDTMPDALDTFYSDTGDQQQEPPDQKEKKIQVAIEVVVPTGGGDEENKVGKHVTMYSFTMDSIASDTLEQRNITNLENVPYALYEDKDEGIFGDFDQLPRKFIFRSEWQENGKTFIGVDTFTVLNTFDQWQSAKVTAEEQ